MRHSFYKASVLTRHSRDQFSFKLSTSRLERRCYQDWTSCDQCLIRELQFFQTEATHGNSEVLELLVEFFVSTITQDRIQSDWLRGCDRWIVSCHTNSKGNPAYLISCWYWATLGYHSVRLGAVYIRTRCRLRFCRNGGKQGRKINTHTHTTDTVRTYSKVQYRSLPQVPTCCPIHGPSPWSFERL